MGKQHITLTTSERRKIKQLSKRKLLSHRARQQLEVLLVLDKKSESIIAIAQRIGISTQTLSKWRAAFREKRLDSLIVITEKFSKIGTTKKGKVKIVLSNVDLDVKLNGEESINQSNDLANLKKKIASDNSERIE